jgi:ATP-dependent RNA helicase DeaD
METFDEMKIEKDILADLNSHGISAPTIVQQKSMPFIFKGKDILVQSETGSGKTICFAVPAIQSIEKGKGIQTLVITPTRELAKQVAEEFMKFSKSKKLRTAIIYGGVSINNQITDLKSSEIVVGTPGRLLDILNRNMMNLSKCKMFIIDEADKLLEMGFIEDVQKILAFLPKERQTLMFSATINSEINKIASKYLKTPEKIMLENILKKGMLKQFYYDVNNKDKISLLVHLLKKNRGLALVFANTKSQTRFISTILRKNKIQADCINGDMSQSAREKVLKNFSSGRIDTLVATDVAARGIHVDDITHVINYDLPEDSQTFLHRIGRTARNGKKGTAIIILSDRDYPKMDKIKKELKQEIEKAPAEEFEKIKIEHKDSGFKRNFSRNSSGQRGSSREGRLRNNRTRR